MTDPAVEQWREATGESTSARLRSAERERDAALADRDAVALIADMLRAELTAVQQELGFSRQAEDDLRAQLERELQRRAGVHEALTSATVENQRLRDLLDQMTARFAGEAERLHGLLDKARAGMYVARDDYGLTCLDCDQPIVRGQAVESQPEGAFRHAACPNPTKEN